MRVLANTPWLAVVLLRQPLNAYVRVGNQPIFLRQPIGDPEDKTNA